MLRMLKFYAYVKQNIVLAVIEMAAETKSSSLNLSDFELKEIPELVFSLKDLTRLYLDKNSLRSVPEEMSELKCLRVLTLDYNALSSVPPSLTRLTELVCLNLSYNNLGHLIPEIGMLRSLEVLWLNHAHLESFPPEIGNCAFLDTLGARGNFLKELPPEIGKLRRLRWLTLEGNLISRVPEEIVGMQRLVHLNLSNNQFESFPEILGLRDLKFVFLSQNFITSLDVSYLRLLEFIRMIDLRDNPLPQDLVCYKTVKNLKLDESFVLTQEDPGEESDSDSEEWEESAPSSDLDISESSVEGMHLDDILEAALPQVAKFTVTGI